MLESTQNKKKYSCQQTNNIYISIIIKLLASLRGIYQMHSHSLFLFSRRVLWRAREGSLFCNNYTQLLLKKVLSIASSLARSLCFVCAFLCLFDSFIVNCYVCQYKHCFYFEYSYSLECSSVVHIAELEHLLLASPAGTACAPFRCVQCRSALMRDHRVVNRLLLLLLSVAILMHRVLKVQINLVRLLSYETSSLGNDIYDFPLLASDWDLQALFFSPHLVHLLLEVNNKALYHVDQTILTFYFQL